MACSPSGTARARASTAPATCSATPILPAPSKHGGVLALMGDDHTAEILDHRASVRVPLRRRDDPDPQPGRRAGAPRLRPLRLGDVALLPARGSALKCVHETIESTAVDRRQPRPASTSSRPATSSMPDGGLNIRLADSILGQEARLHDFKRDAMLAFVRANKLNRIDHLGRRATRRSASSRVGKSYLDVRQALDELGIDEVALQRARHSGSTRSAAPGRSAARAAEFAARARSHHRRRGEALADRGAGARGALRHRQPAGLHRQEGRAGQLAVPGQGRARSQRRRDLHRRAAAANIGRNDDIAGARGAAQGRSSASLAETTRRRAAHPVFLLRLPAQYLDRGAGRHARLCGHRLPLHGAVDGPLDARLHPDGRRGRQLDRRGAVLQARRTCSRISATAPTTIPATWRSARAIASGVNITYKILFNDAVAMTGGQAERRRPHRAADRPPGRRRRRQARRRRHRRAATNTPSDERLAAGPHHPSPRRSRSRCRRELAEIPGVTVLIYDQTCAAEKRRRRKRGTFPDPDKRVIINELVCEGCGDCGVQSNCVSVQPLETEFGRKRTHRPVELQQGFFLRQGLLPVVRHRARRQAARRRAGVAEPLTNWPALPEPAAAGDRADLQHHRHRRRRHRRRHHRRHSRHGGPSRRQGRAACIDMAGPRAEGRRRLQPRAHRRAAGRHPRHPRRGRRAPISCSAATSSWPAARRCWRRCKQGATVMVVNTGRDSCPAISPAMPISRCRPSGSSGRSRAAAGRRASAFHRRDAARDRAVRQFARRQHVHGRLRLSARRAAAVGGGDRAGDRAQRRGGRDEPGRVPLGPPRRRSSRSAVEALARPAGRRARATPRHLSEIARRDASRGASLS